MSQAKFMGFDNVSGGSDWQGRFGTAGYCYHHLSTFTSVVPSWFSSTEFTTYTGANVRTSTWSDRPGRRHLQVYDKSVLASRVFVGNVANTDPEQGFILKLRDAGNTPTLVSFYQIDHDTDRRRHEYSVWDKDRTTNITGTIPLTQSYEAGLWARFITVGDVDVVIRKTAGTNPNISGFLFDRYDPHAIGSSSRPGHILF